MNETKFIPKSVADELAPSQDQESLESAFSDFWREFFIQNGDNSDSAAEKSQKIAKLLSNPNNLNTSFKAPLNVSESTIAKFDEEGGVELSDRGQELLSLISKILGVKEEFLYPKIQENPDDAFIAIMQAVNNISEKFKAGYHDNTATIALKIQHPEEYNKYEASIKKESLVQLLGRLFGELETATNGGSKAIDANFWEASVTAKILTDRLNSLSESEAKANPQDLVAILGLNSMYDSGDEKPVGI